MHWAKRASAAAGIYRIVDRAFGRDDLHRPERSLIGRDFHVRGHGIEQQRADGAEAGDLGRAFERHVERGLDLLGRAGEIDLDAIALDAHADLDRQPHVAVLAVVVEKALGAIFAVGNGGDALTQHALGVVHQLLGRVEHDLPAVAVHQLDEAFGAEPRRSDLRIEIVLQLPRGAAVAADEFPHRLVALAALVKLGAGKQHALGENVGDVDDQSRRRRADVEMVRGVGRISDQHALVENRHDDRDIRRMARSVIGVIVDDEVALMPFAVLQRIANAGEIARQRADMQRRRFRLAQRVEIGVEQSGAEILRLADDRGKRHAVEHMPHFFGDGLQRAVDHLQRDRIDRFSGHGSLLSAAR